MGSKTGGARDGQPAAPSVPESFENYREYSRVKLAPPYDKGEITFYVNMSSVEARALEGRTVYDFMAFVIRDWTFIDSQGVKLPIVAETWERLPIPMVDAIVAKWGEVRDAARNLHQTGASPVTTDAAPSPTPAAPAESSPSTPSSTDSPGITAPSPGT